MTHINSTEIAVQHSAQSLGFGHLAHGHEALQTSGGVTCAPCLLRSDIVPCIGSRVAGRTGWRVRYQELAPFEDGVRYRKSRWIRSLQVTLSQAGHVLRIESPWPRGEREYSEFPSSESDDRSLSGPCVRIVRFSRSRPVVGFFKALKSTCVSGHVPLDGIKQLRAFHAAVSVNGDLRDLWIMTFRGLLDSTPARGFDPVLFRDQRRHFVDSNTGEWLFGGSV